MIVRDLIELKNIMSERVNLGLDIGSFDVLSKEGNTSPKMMSIGLHCRLIGRPGRIQSLSKFLDYVLKHEDIWICKRIDIAKHWIKNHSI